MLNKRRTQRQLIFVISCLLLLLILFLFQPKCPIWDFIGVPCPLCGATRALFALSRGDILAAWQYNFFLPVWLLLFGNLLWVYWSYASQKILLSEIWAHAWISKIPLLALGGLWFSGVALNLRTYGLNSDSWLGYWF